MELIIVTLGLVVIGLWYKSTFLQIIGGFVAIAFGVYWLQEDTSFLYLIEGIAAAGVGIYILINEVVGLIPLLVVVGLIIVAVINGLWAIKKG